MALNPLPAPSRSEARAIIVGSGSLWASILPLASNPADPPWWAVVLVLFGIAAGWWLHLGGVVHVAARNEGLRVLPWLRSLPAGPRGAIHLVRSCGRAMAPAFFLRSCRVLNWPPGVVMPVLVGLLVTDLALLVASSPG